ncbi:MAG: preprotein translocase subunit SecY [Candidatus Saliniplasma sp.]
MAEDEEKSRLYKLKPLVDRMPAVKQPEGHVHFRRKIIWTVLILVVYLCMTNILVYGLDPAQTMDLFEQFRAIFAGESGSIVHLGIMPIVNASIIMQLFQGADIINLDMKDEEDKAVYQNTQKFLVIVMILVQAVPQVYGFLVPGQGFIDVLNGMVAGHGELLARVIIIIQLSVGCYLLFLMDEVVSKWGIGSGISLFIVAGVAQGIFTGIFNWAPDPMGRTEAPVGAIPRTIYTMQHSSAQEFVGGGFETLLLQPPNALITIPTTILIFLMVAYVQSSRVELPLAHGRARGARGRYPLKLIYASVIPVILVSALLANINLFSMLFYTNPTFQNFPIFGEAAWLGVFQPGSTEPISGAAWYISNVKGLSDWLLPLISERYAGSMSPEGVSWTYSKLQIIARVISHFIFMTVFAILFSIFWVRTTNMDAESVAEQIQDSGMQIPGFRRDPRVLRKVLERYIPAITVFSGFFIGALAAGANMIGTVGDAGGVSLFLAISILTELYEQMGKEQMMEMHPVLRDFFGNQ